MNIVFKRILIFSLFLIFQNAESLAQQNVLIFQNAIENADPQKFNAFIAQADFEKINVSISNNSQDLTFNNLRKYQAIVFFEFNINKLTLSESSALVSYFKSGGGVAAVNDVFQNENKWIWFEQFFGKIFKISNSLTNIDVLTLQNIGWETLPPLWSIKDFDLELLNITASKKPVLMNLNGKTISWISKTEFGNQSFYTSLGGNAETWGNKIFIDHLIGGIKQISGKIQEDSLGQFPDLLPVKEAFKTYLVLDSLQHASIVKCLNPSEILIYGDDGSLIKYMPESKQKVFLGKIDSLANASAITLDPEFEQNRNLYFYFPKSNGMANARRLKILEGDSLWLDTFSQESSMPDNKSFMFDLANFQASELALPAYYSKKNLLLLENGFFEVETLNEKSEIISREPFILDFQSQKIQSFTFNAAAEMYVLDESKLQKILFNKENHFPPIVDFYFETLSKKVPLKVNFTAKELSDNKEVNYIWYVDNQVFAGKNISFIFKKFGKYNVKLTATNQHGQSDSIQKTILFKK